MNISLIICALAACDIPSKSVTATAEDDGGSDDEGTGDDSATGNSPGSMSASSSAEGGSLEDGGEDTGDPTIPIPECLDEITVLASSAEVSPLGFAADDVLAYAQAQHISTFGWLNEGPILVTTAGPPSQLLITVDYHDFEVRYVESQPNPDNPNDGAFECASRLEIDIRLSFATGDGQFAETFPEFSVLTATSVESASFRQSVEPSGFSGDFSADDIMFVDAEGGIEGFDVNGTITDGPEVTTTGGLWVSGVLVPNDLGGDGLAFYGTLGSWPAP